MDLADKLTIGQQVWRVLDIQGDKALVITEHIIEHRPYSDAYVNMTWAQCSLRAYLNGEFLNTFTAEERQRIIPCENQNNDNPWYGTPGGEPTLDSVFLLSIEEVVCQYFGDSSAKLYQPKKGQRYWFERKDANNAKRQATTLQNEGWWWWLRTPGRVGVKAVYVHGDGNIGIQGNNILKGNLADGRCTGGVRPAMWIKVQA